MVKHPLETIRHSLAHVLAMAVLELLPDTKLGIGPAIENGFYYDFDFKKNTISEDSLPKIEAKMKELIKRDLKFVKKEISVEEAKKKFRGQPYKLELVDDLKKERAKKVNVYESGGFFDLCKGPHVSSTKVLNSDAFKLTKIAGAYWKGHEKNPQLQRVYGVAFENKKKLQEYLKLLAEAENRDHRKLGKQLDLFHFSDLVGPGLPLFTPKGVIIIDELKKHIEKICGSYGFKKVLTPHLAKIKLYELSGHAKKFNEELFYVSSSRKHEFVIRPVLCPHQTQIYASRPRSYRDLPIRYMETEKMYRAEKPGEIGGLNRVYAITIEDGHSFCRVDQVKQEIKNIVNIIKNFYQSLDMWGNHWVSLSVRDYQHPEKYIGDPKDWDVCEKILKEVSEEMNLKARKREGEAALYGPKLDFMFKDALGREIQIPTVQIDFATPKRFNLVYTDQKGNEVHPVMVHRAILGSYERFLALLIEYFGGALPFWLSPVQVAILSVNDKQESIRYCLSLIKEFKNHNVRVELDRRNESIGKKIREAELQKIPYLLIIGDKEVKSKTIRVRERGKGDVGAKKLKSFLKNLAR